MSERERPDRFDGDARPGADADICPLCGYAAPLGEHSAAGSRVCSSCGGTWQAPTARPFIPDRRRGATTWL